MKNKNKTLEHCAFYFKMRILFFLLFIANVSTLSYASDSKYK